MSIICIVFEFKSLGNLDNCIYGVYVIPKNMIGRLELETFHNNVFYLFTKHKAIFKIFRLILNNDYFTNNNLL